MCGFPPVVGVITGFENGFGLEVVITIVCSCIIHIIHDMLLYVFLNNIILI